MPIYNWNKEYTRKEDGRVYCHVKNHDPPIQYRNRLVYCNHHNITLDKIKGKHVHHKDKDRTNDSIENLELLTATEHNKIHPEKATGKRSTEVCAKFSKVQKNLWASGFYTNRKPRKRNYSENIVKQVLGLSEQGVSQVKIAKIVGIPRTSAQNIIYKGA